MRLVVINRQVDETVVFLLRHLKFLASLFENVLLVVFLSEFSGPLALLKLFEFFLETRTP